MAGRWRDTPVRRVEHAHRVAPTVPSVSSGGRSVDRSRPRPTRGSSSGHRRRRGPAGASLLVGIGVVLLAVLLRPWDGTGAGASANRPPRTPAATAPTVAPRTPSRSLAAHGDGVISEPASSETPASVGGPPGATEPPAAPLLAGYEWPIRNARITNAYGLGRPGSFVVDGVAFHDGLDIASFCGARITAAHDGVVLGAGRRTEGLLGWVGDLGPFRAKLDAEDGWRRQAITVVVDDGNRYRSVYAHLGVAVVEAGDAVVAGDLLGYEGASGHATGCHLHYAVFDPDGEERLTLEPKTARKTRLPPLEIARIDPLLVLPPPETAGITWGWGSR